MQINIILSEYPFSRLLSLLYIVTVISRLRNKATHPRVEECDILRCVVQQLRLGSCLTSLSLSSLCLTASMVLQLAQVLRLYHVCTSNFKIYSLPVLK